MREIKIPAATMLEDIVSVSVIQGVSVNVSVSTGRMVTQQYLAPSPGKSGLVPATRDVFEATGDLTGYSVSGDDYAELMSAGPSWSPSKPAGVFRIDDLWHYIDKYRVAL